MEDKMTDIVDELRQGSLNNDDYRWKAADRIEQLEAALRAVMDDLTLIGENHWFLVGLLDDVIYVNARAALEEPK
jgi:hypothetical protein